MTEQLKPEQPKTEVTITEPGVAEITIELDEPSSSTSERKNDTSTILKNEPGGEAAAVENTSRDRAFVEQANETMNSLIRRLFQKVADLSIDADTVQQTSENLVELAKQIDVTNATRCGILNKPGSDELPNWVGNVGVQEESENYLRLVIPRTWKDKPIIVQKIMTHWDVSLYRLELDENLSDRNWVDEKIEELAELRRLKQQVAATLETIMVNAKQIENCVEAMQAGLSGKDEPSDIELLIRSLALKIEHEVRRHLKVNLEATVNDDFF